MDSQHRRTVKFLIAVFTGVLLPAIFCACMNSQVLPQIVIPAEHFATHLAWKSSWRIATTASLIHVPIKVILPTELLLANVAMIGLQTSMYVHVTC